jgi:hypothetical protein
VIHYVFILDMPNNNAWNRQWTGAGNLYCICRSYAPKSELLKNVEQKDYHYYNFGDGWGVSVQIKKVDGKEKTKYQRASKGFCGYDWMVAEIEHLGRIKSLDDRIVKVPEATP